MNLDLTSGLRPSVSKPDDRASTRIENKGGQARNGQKRQPNERESAGDLRFRGEKWRRGEIRTKKPEEKKRRRRDGIQGIKLAGER